jgi:hypothetical protein
MKKYRASLILLAVLTLVATFLLIKNSGGTFRKKDNSFAISDTSNVTKFFLTDKKNNSVTVVRTPNGNWVLNDKYDVDPSMINVILNTFISIEPKSPIARGTRNTIIRMLAGKSVKTEIYQRVYRINIFDKIKLFPHEKLTRTYYVGDPTMDNSGTFMLMEGSEDPYIVNIPGFRGFVGTRYSALEGDWRSHSVFRVRVPEIKSVTVNFSDRPTHSFRITNKDNKFFTLTSLFDNKEIPKFDTTKVVGFLSMFRNLNYERVLDEMKQTKYDSILNVTPTNEIVLVDKLGKSHSLKMWKRKADIGQLDLDGNQAEWDLERMYALIDKSEYLVTVQYFVFNEVLPPLPWFISDTGQQN